MVRRILVAVVVLALSAPLFAAHRWSTYHWRKGSGPVTPPVVMNITSPWTNYASRVMTDWNASTVIESPWSYGAISSRKRCTSTTGQIEVCNSTYGQNGWLGIAGISLSGGHIVKGYTKLNDTYYNTATYNTPAWRRMVFCQEVGHDYGLGHVNENFNDPNTGSCMDYTNNPGRDDGAGTNEYPNSHDYNELLTIYNHTDALVFDAITEDATRPRTIEEIMNKADQWGTPIAFDEQGRPNVFFRPTAPNHGGGNFGDAPMLEGELIDVFWAPVEPVEFGHDKPGKEIGVK